jgi:A/G-specific adenine glycosylase
MTKLQPETDRIAHLRSQLLQWYELNQRDLPWRRTPDPYAIWVSEIMLQQTRVAVVVERYNAFLLRFPTLVSLAEAPEQEVLALWSGLGYYRRARMLHKAAQFVARELQGSLPANAKDLRLLPGIGPYTAAAIASIAHQEPVAVVDGNVERVLCRLSGWEAGSRTGASKLRGKIEKLASALVDPLRPGDFNQAMMELGATVCTPRTPLCLQCPINVDCTTLGEHNTPARPKMISREIAHALAVRAGVEADTASRHILLEQRPHSVSVMPGLWELPLLLDPQVPDSELRMAVRHAIMQVNYYVRIRTLREDEVDALTVPGGARLWVPLAEAGQMALTGLARKVLSRARLLPLSVAAPNT